jgi:uncharacterized protein
VTEKNPYLVNVRDLVRNPGEQRERDYTVVAPERLGEGLAWVPEGREIDLTLRFESVHEGILVTGEAFTTADAQSARSLTEFTLPVEVDFQELFAYPSEVPSDYEVQGDHVDLEPVVRDAVVLALPFQPEFAGDLDEVELPEGVTLVLADEEPEPRTDERWAALRQLRDETDDVSTEER